MTDIHFLTVALAFITRHYGGPEEGGWHWDQTEPAEPDAQFIPVVCLNYREAHLAWERMTTTLEASNLNFGRFPLHSVLSTGWYRIEIFNNYPSVTPERTPTYA